MKRILYFLLLMVISQSVFSQYTVTKIIGEVRLKSSGEALKPGSSLRDDDVLLFSTPGDMVRAIVPGKGIYLISPSPRAEKKTNAIVEMLKSTLQIKSKEGYLSGRSEENELVPEAFETEPSVNPFTLISKENPYLFDQRKYDASAGSRFFLQVENPGDKPVIKSLRTKGDTLFLMSSDFETRPDAVSRLGFFNATSRKSELLAQIKPNIDSSNVMGEIIRSLIGAEKKSNKDSIMRTCYSEVYRALGKPSAILFASRFNKAFAEVSAPMK